MIKFVQGHPVEWKTAVQQGSGSSQLNLLLRKKAEVVAALLEDRLDTAKVVECQHDGFSAPPESSHHREPPQ